LVRIVFGLVLALGLGYPMFGRNLATSVVRFSENHGFSAGFDNRVDTGAEKRSDIILRLFPIFILFSH
jgi:hypothetical protein